MPDEERESDEAQDRESAPVTAEGTQVQFWDWGLAIFVGVMAACAVAHAYFN